jgi:hypothetical protein
MYIYAHDGGWFKKKKIELITSETINMNFENVEPPYISIITHLEDKTTFKVFYWSEEEANRGHRRIMINKGLK